MTYSIFYYFGWAGLWLNPSEIDWLVKSVRLKTNMESELDALLFLQLVFTASRLLCSLSEKDVFPVKPETSG